MNYKEVLSEVGDWTGVYANLCLEEDITWNVIGVLTNIIKCDSIGIPVSTRALALHCNITQRTVMTSIGVLKLKGIISPQKIGYSVNYERLKNLAIECNKKSKAISKTSKSDEKISSPHKKEETQVMKNFHQERCKNFIAGDEKNASIINNNINNNKYIYNTNTEYLNTEVKKDISVKNVPEVLKEEEISVPFENDKYIFSSSVEGNESAGNNTSSAERLNSLRSRVEDAKKELISEFETIVQGGDEYIAVLNDCYFKWEKYRERIVNAAINSKCLEEEYQLLSDYFIDSCRLHVMYEEMAGGKFIGKCLQPSIVSGNLERAMYEYQKNNKRATA